jgi:hypothetical protein
LQLDDAGAVSGGWSGTERLCLDPLAPVEGGGVLRRPVPTLPD